VDENEHSTLGAFIALLAVLALYGFAWLYELALYFVVYVAGRH
jgi:hypothetical protein